MPTSFGKKVKKTKKSTEKKSAPSAATKKLRHQAKCLGIKLTRKTSTGKRNYKSDKMLKQQIKNKSKKNVRGARKTSRPKPRTRFGSSLANASSGAGTASDGRLTFSMSGCNSPVEDSQVCGPSNSALYTDALRSATYPYVSYGSLKGDGPPSEWSANTPQTLSTVWPQSSESFRNSYGALLKKRQSIINRLKRL